MICGKCMRPIEFAALWDMPQDLDNPAVQSGDGICVTMKQRLLRMAVCKECA